MIDRLTFDQAGAPEHRLPPSNIEAEEAVLGSALLDREVVGRVSSLLTPADFYRERHGIVFEAMTRLYDRQDPVDYLTLIAELEQREALEQCGGISFLSGLLMAVPTPIHAEHYAKIVAEAAVMRRLISAGGKIAAIGFAHEADSATAIQRAEQLLRDASARRVLQAHLPLSEALRKYLDEIAARQAGDLSTVAVPTGYRDLDRLLHGGMHRSNLVILAARPSMGKTSLAMGIAVYAATTWRAGVAVFSLEMSDKELAARVLASESGVDSRRIADGQLTDVESRKLGHAIGGLAEAPIVIDPSPSITVSELRHRVRRMQHENPLDLVIVDHLQLMTSSMRGEGRVQEMGEITRQLKVLAREENIAVLVLSQLSRAVEQRSPKIPQLSDLRESGAIEQDADVVVFIYRDDYYNRDSEKQGVADLHIAKHRNGPTGEVSLLFNQRTTKFLDLEVYQ